MPAPATNEAAMIRMSESMVQPMVLNLVPAKYDGVVYAPAERAQDIPLAVQWALILPQRGEALQQRLAVCTVISDELFETVERELIKACTAVWSGVPAVTSSTGNARSAILSIGTSHLTAA